MAFSEAVSPEVMLGKATTPPTSVPMNVARVMVGTGIGPECFAFVHGDDEKRPNDSDLSCLRELQVSVPRMPDCPRPSAHCKRRRPISQVAWATLPARQRFPHTPEAPLADRAEAWP